jgi:hypothetical protein
MSARAWLGERRGTFPSRLAAVAGAAATVAV